MNLEDKKNQLNELTSPGVYVVKPEVKALPYIGGSFAQPQVPQPSGMANEYEEIVDRQSKYAASPAWEHFKENIPFVSWGYREFEEMRGEDNTPAYDPTPEEREANLKYIDKYGKPQKLEGNDAFWLNSSGTQKVFEIRKQQAIRRIAAEREQLEKNGMVATLGTSLAGEVFNPVNYIPFVGQNAVVAKFTNAADKARRLANAEKILQAGSKSLEAGQTAVQGLSRGERFVRGGLGNVAVGVPAGFINEVGQRNDYGVSDFGLDVLFNMTIGGALDGVVFGKADKKFVTELDDRIAKAQLTYQASRAVHKTELPEEAAIDVIAPPPKSLDKEPEALPSVEELKQAEQSVPEATPAVGEPKFENPMDYMAHKVAESEDPKVVDDYKAKLEESLPGWSENRMNDYIETVAKKVNEARKSGNTEPIADLMKTIGINEQDLLKAIDEVLPSPAKTQENELRVPETALDTQNTTDLPEHVFDGDSPVVSFGQDDKAHNAARLDERLTDTSLTTRQKGNLVRKAFKNGEITEERMKATLLNIKKQTEAEKGNKKVKEKKTKEKTVAPQDKAILDKVVDDSIKAREIIEDIQSSLDDTPLVKQEEVPQEILLDVNEIGQPDVEPVVETPKEPDYVLTPEEVRNYEHKESVTEDVPEYLHEFVSQALRNEVLEIDGVPAAFESDIDKALAILTNKEHKLRGDALTLLNKMFDDLTEEDLMKYARELQLNIPATKQGDVYKVPKFWEVIDQHGPETKVVELETHLHEDGSVSIVYRNGKQEDITAERMVRGRGREATAAATQREIENMNRALMVVQDSASKAELGDEMEAVDQLLDKLKKLKGKTKTDKARINYFLNRKERLKEINQHASSLSADGLRKQIKGLHVALEMLEKSAKVVGKKHLTDEIPAENLVRTAEGKLDIEATQAQMEIRKALEEGWVEVKPGEDVEKPKAKDKKVAAGVALVGASGAASAAQEDKQQDAASGLLATAGIVAVAMFGGKVFKRVGKRTVSKTVAKTSRIGERVVDRAFFGWGMAARVINSGNPVAKSLAERLMTNGAGSAGGPDVWANNTMSRYSAKFMDSFKEGLGEYSKSVGNAITKYIPHANWGEFSRLVTSVKLGHIADAPPGVMKAVKAMIDNERNILKEHSDLFDKVAALLKSRGLSMEESRARHFRFISPDEKYFHLSADINAYNTLMEKLSGMGLNEKQAIGEIQALFEASLRSGTAGYSIPWSDKLIKKMAEVKTNVFTKLRANIEFEKMSVEQLAEFGERLREFGFSDEEVKDIKLLAEQGKQEFKEGTTATRSRLPWDTKASITLPNGETLRFMDLHNTNAFDVHRGWLNQVSGDIALMKHTLEYFARTGEVIDFTHENFFLKARQAVAKGSGSNIDDVVKFFDGLERNLYGIPPADDTSVSTINDIARVGNNIAMTRAVGMLSKAVVVDAISNAFASPRTFLQTIPLLRNLVEGANAKTLRKEYLKELRDEFGIGLERHLHVAYKENMGLKSWMTSVLGEKNTGPGFLKSVAHDLQNLNGVIAYATFLNKSAAWGKETSMRTLNKLLLDGYRKGTNKLTKYMESYGVNPEMQERILKLFAHAEHTDTGVLMKLNVDEMKKSDFDAYLAYQKFAARFIKARTGELHFTEHLPEAHTAVGKMGTFLMGATQSTAIHGLKNLRDMPLDPTVAYLAGTSIVAAALGYIANVYIMFGNDEEKLNKALRWDAIATNAINRSNMSGWTSAYVSTAYQLGGYEDPLSASRTRDKFGIAALQAANNTFNAAQSVASLLKEDDEFTANELKNIATVFGFNNVLLPVAVNALMGDSK